VNPLKTIVDLALLQAKPQDLPYSWALLGLLASASTLSYVLALEVVGSQLTQVVGQEIPIVPLAIAEHAFFALTIWLILRLALKSERFCQTLSAMFAGNTLVQLAMWPVSQWMVNAQGTAAANTPTLLLLGLRVWLLLIFAHIFKEALEVRMGLGVLFTIGCWIFTSVLLLLFLSFLG
jgi:hypothetical protein